MTKKPKPTKLNRVSITMPADIHAKALKQAKKDGFETSFSAWISKIVKDATT